MELLKIASDAYANWKYASQQDDLMGMTHPTGQTTKEEVEKRYGRKVRKTRQFSLKGNDIVMHDNEPIDTEMMSAISHFRSKNKDGKYAPNGMTVHYF